MISEVLGDSDEILAKAGVEFIGREWETWPHVMSRWLLRDFDGVKERNGVFNKLLDGDPKFLNMFLVGKPYKSQFRPGWHFRDVVRVYFLFTFSNMFFLSVSYSSYSRLGCLKLNRQPQR